MREILGAVLINIKTNRSVWNSAESDGLKLTRFLGDGNASLLININAIAAQLAILKGIDENSQESEKCAPAI